MWIAAAIIILLLLVGETVLVMPDKMPWKRRRKK